MALDNNKESKLDEQLERAVVKVFAGAAQGSGFFVSPRRLVTNRHVVLPGDVPAAVTIKLFDGARIENLRVEPTPWPSGLDVAILALPADEPDPDIVPAVLDNRPVLPGTRVIGAGFPGVNEAATVKASYLAERYSCDSTNAKLESGADHDDAARETATTFARYLRLTGSAVQKGMSGGPVVSLETGFVVGVLRVGNVKNPQSGGYAIPMEIVSEFIPPLERLSLSPSPASRAWVEVLGARHLKDVGREANGVVFDQPQVERIEITVSPVQGGAPDVPGPWEVTLAASSWQEDESGGVTVGPEVVQVGHLGDDLIGALDRWARRRGLSGTHEIELLGRVLNRAMFPEPVATALHRRVAGGGGAPLVRVGVDRNCWLAGIPWEFAGSDPNSAINQPPLGTRGDLAFSRAFAAASSVTRSTRDRTRLSILGLIVCPQHVHRELGLRPNESNQLKPPQGHRELQAKLAEALAPTHEGEGGRQERDDRFVPKILVNPLFTTFETELKQGDVRFDQPWDVVHYVGFGWQLAGDIVLGFAEDREGCEWMAISLNDVMAALRVHPPTLLVVELLANPPGRFPEGVGLTDLLGLLDAGPAALVVTQHPVTDRAIQTFNNAFYQAIASGDAVEQATQTARREVRQRKDLNDPPAFGAFTCATTGAGHVVLLTKKPPPSKPAQPGPNGSGDGQRAHMATSDEFAAHGN